MTEETKTDTNKQLVGSKFQPVKVVLKGRMMSVVERICETCSFMLIVKSEGVMCGDTDDEECDKVKLLIYSAM